jgi:pimeloyl-ACP methyl ester carboxylesterase
MHGTIYGAGHWRTLCRWVIETWGRQPDWTDADLAAVTAPSRIGRGQFDDRVVQSQIDRMVRAMPNARRFVVPGVGHYFHAARPGNEALGRVMLELFDSTRTGVRLPS